MTVLYKLTDENHRTYGDCQWGPGVTHETDGGGELCGPGWLHTIMHYHIDITINTEAGEYDHTVATDSLNEVMQSMLARYRDCTSVVMAIVPNAEHYPTTFQAERITKS